MTTASTCAQAGSNTWRLLTHRGARCPLSLMLGWLEDCRGRWWVTWMWIYASPIRFVLILFISLPYYTWLYPYDRLPLRYLTKNFDDAADSKGERLMRREEMTLPRILRCNMHQGLQKEWKWKAQLETIDYLHYLTYLTNWRQIIQILQKTQIFQIIVK